jgi:hypothetical protein
MKFLTGLLTLLIFTSAHASYFATHCSNSTATIKWETGHNSNHLYYARPDMKGVSVSYYKLNAEFLDEVILREDRVQNCGYSSFTKVFAAKVIITPADQHPNALDFLDGEKKIEAEVICTTHMNSRSYCP